MILSWMLYVLFVGSALAIGALALELIVRRASLPTRFVWMAALTGIVGLALLAPRHGDAGVSVPLPAATDVTSHAAAPTATESIAATALRLQRETYSMLSHAFAFVQMRVPRRVARGISLAWGLSTLALLLLFVAVSNQMDGERRRWPLTRIAGARVRLAPSVGPAVVGLSKPEIVVPRWLLGRDTEDQRLVIVHESEHLAANDQLLLMAGWFVVVVLPWHPAAWWMMSRLRLAIELDCDARVLKRGVPARNYGSLLIDIAGQCAGHRLGALALADKTSHLHRRLLAMKPTRTRFTAIRVAALGAVASLAVLAACEARLPTASEIATMDVASAQKSASVLLPPPGTGYEYYVDGKLVAEAEARAVDGSRIASMLMSKPADASPGAKASVRIATTGSAEEAATRGELAKRRASGATQPTDIYVPYGAGAPLVIIDGVVAEKSAITKVASADVESVEVLKGASARAKSPLPQAANGIIMITTKKGR